MHEGVSDGSLAHVVGASSPALRNVPIGEAFDEACRRFSHNDALISCHQGLRYTYQDLQRAVDRLVVGLSRLGLHAGDRVGIWSPNCAEWVVLQFACAKAGLILVTINPAYRRDELQYTVDKVGCRALVLAPRFKTSDYVEIVRSLRPIHLEQLSEERSDGADDAAATGLPALEFFVTIGPETFFGFQPFDALSADPAPQEALAPTISAFEPTNIQFTSGTTGLPKGATLTHHNILNNAYFVGRAMSFSEADRLCLPVPLYHCFGMVMGTLLTMQYGAAVVLPSASFDPTATLRAVDEEGCTALYGVPTMFVAMLEAAESLPDASFVSLRTGVMAGAPCPEPLMRKVVDRLNMREVVVGYGMTETSPISWISDRETPLSRRVSTVGKVAPHAEVKIVDEAGATVQRGEEGEFMTRGYLVMNAYWNDEEKTRDVLTPDGWMRTGDLGVIDEEGYARVTGRLKDMVIRGGENISPREVEEFLMTAPNVRDVQVFGVPDQKYGEELCAWIIVEDEKLESEQSIRSYCKDRIAHFKVPKYLKFVEAFPMTATGKPRKVEMREHMTKTLDIAASGATTRGA